MLEYLEIFENDANTPLHYWERLHNSKEKKNNLIKSLIFLRECLLAYLWVFNSPLSDTHPPDLLRSQNTKLNPLHRLHGRLGVARDDRRHDGRPVRNFLKELTLLTRAKQLHIGVITLLFHNGKMAACQAWSCHHAIL